MRLLRCLAIAMLPATSLAHETLGAMERHELPSAICADGSPGLIYMAANESSSDYMIYLQGGGGCAHSKAVCDVLREESSHLFTSKNFPHSAAGYSFLSEDEEQNRLYSTYNRVFVPYCTMDMYLLDTESEDGSLQFRGRPLLEEALGFILNPSKNDTRVVFGGASAGGVGAFNAAEWLLDTFDQVTELSVILDSAFFFDVEGYLVPLLEYIQEDPSVAYSPQCSVEFDRGPCCVQFGCMLQQGLYPTTTDKLRGTFALSGGQDVMAAVQTAALGTFDDSIPEMLWSTAVFTGRTEASLRNLASLFPETLAVFSPSCIDHVFVLSSELDMAPCVPALGVAVDSLCATTCIMGESGRAIGRTCVGDLDAGLKFRATQSEDAWNQLKINGTSLRDAMELWWYGRGDASKQVRLFDTCDDPHCNPTCLGDILTAGRGGTDGSLTWTLVSIVLGFAAILLGAGLSAVVWSCLQWKQVEAIMEVRLLEDMERSATGLARGAKDAGQLKPGGAGGEDYGSALPALEWQDLSYWVPLKKAWSLPSWGSPKDEVPVPEKQLLFSVDGKVPKGALCALMGPSGSGKSTLLDLLTGRRSFGRCEGDILFEGKSIATMQKSYVACAGYMRQSDVGMLPGLSVFDNLVYAAMIRIKGTLEHQLSRVQSVMEETSLVLSQNTTAGSLSGGQKRRLMLALQLLARRSILFLDEPTSGVDATASLELITILKRLSKTVTIIVVIHQPRPEIWQLFTHTILVKRGRLVYSGPAHDALDKLSRFLPSQDMPSMPASSQHAPRALGTLTEDPVRVYRDVSDGSSTARGFTYSQDNLDISVQDTARTEDVRPVLERGLSVESMRSKRDFSAPGINRQGSFLDRSLGRGDSLMRGMSFTGERKLRILSVNEPDLDAEVAAAASGHMSVPDKILDMLVRIQHEDVNRVLTHEAATTAMGGGAKASTRFRLATTKEEDSVNFENSATTSLSSGSPVFSARRGDRAGREDEKDMDDVVKTPLWKMSVILMARSGKSGYAKNMICNLAILVTAITVMAVAFREARGDSEMLHLMVTVLFSMVLPVVLMYHPLMIENTWVEWSLTKVEVADGFYPPVCATMRMFFDHLAVGVIASFIVVGIMHCIVWDRFISALPADDLGVNIQLSCGVTLIAWVMIAMFDSLAVSGLHLTMAFSIGVTLTSAWVLFSGTVLLITSIPYVLRALTYTSPHYWNSSFMLRVILDGLDMTDTCAHNNPFYCATVFGDLIADNLDLRMRSNGYNLLAVVFFAIASLAVMVVTVEMRGRHTGILGGLGQPKLRSSSYGARRATAAATRPIRAAPSPSDRR